MKLNAINTFDNIQRFEKRYSSLHGALNSPETKFLFCSFHHSSQLGFSPIKSTSFFSLFIWFSIKQNTALGTKYTEMVPSMIKLRWTNHFFSELEGGRARFNLWRELFV